MMSRLWGQDIQKVGASLSHLSLTVKLPLQAITGILVTAGTLTLLTIVIGTNILRSQAFDSNSYAVQTYASAVGLYLDNAQSLLEFSARLPELRNLAVVSAESLKEAETIESITHGLLERSTVFDYIMLLDLDGSVRLLKSQHDDLPSGNLASTLWYKQLKIAKVTTLSDLHTSNLTGQPTIVMATFIKNTAGQEIAIWAGGLKLQKLSDISLSEMANGARRANVGYLTDRQGLVIAHQSDPTLVSRQADYSGLPPVRFALARQHGLVEFTDPVSQEEHLAAYMPLPVWGWGVISTTPTTTAFAPVAEFRERVIVATLSLALLFTAGAWIVGRRFSGRLRELTWAVQKIGRGSLDYRVDIRSGDEVERLATEFNRMASSLQETQGQLLERTALMEAANKELESFSYSVSHDLRAPLRAVDGFSRILLEEHAPALAPDAARYLRLIRENAQQMGQLISDLLAFSRLSRQPLSVQPVLPAELVHRSLEELKSEHESRKVEVTVSELPTCQGDPSLLHQVFMNLLSNALKYTRKREEARIEVTGHRNGIEAVYSVKDNGAGFDMRYADKLFGVFQRLHRAEEYEGTGVGLAIVQRIVHRHGGRVWAEAEVGKGATFYFTIPGGDNHG